MIVHAITILYHYLLLNLYSFLHQLITLHRHRLSININISFSIILYSIPLQSQSLSPHLEYFVSIRDSVFVLMPDYTVQPACWAACTKQPRCVTNNNDVLLASVSNNLLGTAVTGVTNWRNGGTASGTVRNKVYFGANGDYKLT